MDRARNLEKTSLINCTGHPTQIRGCVLVPRTQQSGSKYNLSSTNSRLLVPFKGKTKTMGDRSFAGGVYLHSGTHCHLRNVRSRTLARLDVNSRHISLELLFISRNISLTIAFLCNAIIIILDLT